MWCSDKTRARILTAALLLPLVGISACGYTLSHRLRAPFSRPGGMFVPVFDNNTDEIGAERIFTNALIRELESRGQILHTGRDQAETELKGVIRGIDMGPIAFTDPGIPNLQSYRRLPTELGITVVLGLTHYDMQTREVLWTKDFVGFRRMLGPVTRLRDSLAPSSIGLLTETLMFSTFSLVAGDIMRDISDDIAEVF